MEKNFKIFVVLALVSCVRAGARLDKLDVKVLDKTKVTCEVKVHLTKPKSVDIDVHALTDAKDISLRLGAFSLIDGNYNEVIETETFSLCEMGKSDNPLIAFVYKEMAKAGNLTLACPIKKGYYHLKAFTIVEEDLQSGGITLPPGNFKIELNATLHMDDGKDHLIVVTDIFFKEEA